MNYNISGLNGCLTLIIFGTIFMFLFRIFASFILMTLPFWLVLAALFAFRNLYRTYITARKPNVTVEEDFSSEANREDEESVMFDENELSRDAEDVEFIEYNDMED